MAGLLWKTCFYKQIVEFRSALRRHTSQLEQLLVLHNQQQQGGRPQQYQQLQLVQQERQQQKEQQERLHVARLTEAFRSFLADSLAFYQKMMAEVSVLKNDIV